MRKTGPLAVVASILALTFIAFGASESSATGFRVVGWVGHRDTSLAPYVDAESFWVEFIFDQSQASSGAQPNEYVFSPDSYSVSLVVDFGISSLDIINSTGNLTLTIFDGQTAFDNGDEIEILWEAGGIEIQPGLVITSLEMHLQLENDAWNSTALPSTAQFNEGTIGSPSGAPPNSIRFSSPLGTVFLFPYDLTSVPEPSTALLLGLGLTTLAASRRGRG